MESLTRELRQYQRSVQRRNRAQGGMCALCSSQAVDGKSRCQDCLQKGRDYSKSRRKENKTAGMCSCGQPPVVGKKTCQDCLQKRELIQAERHDAGLCRCGQLPMVGKKACQDCLNRSIKSTRRYKQTVLDHYGAFCHCECGCRETTFEWLTIDHINNDGAKQRRAGLRGDYSSLIKRGFPDDIQILCFNCNCSKGFYGRCPGRKVANVNNVDCTE